MNPSDDITAVSGRANLARVLVFSSLFPSAVAPTAGTFIKERLFRVGKLRRICVIAPQYWSPLDWIVRFHRPEFRRLAVAFEVVDGIEIHRPIFFSFPGFLKRLDGLLMYLGSRNVAIKIAKTFAPTVIDAHFLYPDGYAASLLAKRLRIPLVVTVRGSKDQILIGTTREPYLRKTIAAASKVISVSESLKSQVVSPLSTDSAKCDVITNGVDLKKFIPDAQISARQKLSIPLTAKVIISVGGLVEGKGFHRVIELIPDLLRTIPDLYYLVVGGGTAHGDMTVALKEQAKSLGIADRVIFCGRQLPQDLHWFYSAADLFVLATRYEGWANVFLEAMACGLPVVTTKVGGNHEVINSISLGTLVRFFDPIQFREAIARALDTPYDKQLIIKYAHQNEWEPKILALTELFDKVSRRTH